MIRVVDIKISQDALTKLTYGGCLSRCNQCHGYTRPAELADGLCLNCRPIPHVRLPVTLDHPIAMMCGCRFALESPGVTAFYHCPHPRVANVVMDTAELIQSFSVPAHHLIVDTADLHEQYPVGEDAAISLSYPRSRDGDQPCH